MSISFIVFKKRRGGFSSVQGRPKKPSLNRVKTLQKSNFLNDTIIIIMNDYGPRFVANRATFQGRLEERLPLMSVTIIITIIILIKSYKYNNNYYFNTCKFKR